ncbi:MAG: NUDIX domain-containing protein [Bacteroidales bacterium]|nr:NUDIX domain-containing protein [Bacteroidales bacterium]
MYKVFIDNKSIIFTKKVKNSYVAKNELVLEYSNNLNLIEEFGKLKTKTEIENLIVLVKEDIENVFDRFLSNFKVLEAGGGLVKNENDKYLLIFRYGKWDLPKGKTEKGEDIESTALREVEEETSLKGAKIDSKLPDTYHYYEHKGKSIVKKTSWFLMFASSKDQHLIPQLIEDIQKVEWMTKGQVQEVLKTSYRSIIELVDMFFDNSVEG